MTIEYPLNMPASGISGIRMNPVAAVSQGESPFTYKQEVQVHQGQKWQVDISLALMDRDEAEEWLSFFLKLNGMEGVFLLSPPQASSPRGTGSGAPVVDGSDQTGQVLQTRGWAASVVGVLRAGDYLSLGTGIASRLYKLLDDAHSDVDGNASLHIWPRLRLSPADGDAIVIQNPKGCFRLTSNQMPHEVSEVFHYSGMDFSAREVL